MTVPTRAVRNPEAPDGDPWHRWCTLVHPRLEAALDARGASSLGVALPDLRDHLARVGFEACARNGEASNPEPALERLLEPARLDDLELMLAFHLGAPAAHRRFMDLHGARLRFLVGRHLGTGALEENVTSVVSHVWERATRFLGMSSLKTWLTAVARNWCTDAIRRAQARPVEAVPRPDGEGGPPEVHELEAPEAPPAQVVACSEFGSALRSASSRAAERLDPAERAILRLRFLEGLSHEDMRRRRELLRPGEACLEPYTLTRRVQRASRALRSHIVACLDAMGYAMADVLDLLERCQGLPSEVARSLAEDMP